MKTISATALVLCLSAAACRGVAVSPSVGSHLDTAPTVEDVRAVSPALTRYAEAIVRADLWHRAELQPRDRGLVTVAALIARQQTVELPYYLNRALDSELEAAELSEMITARSTRAGERDCGGSYRKAGVR
jgi:4-carboxymuconolactone decarboxylase